MRQSRFTQPFAGGMEGEEVSVTAERVLKGILGIHKQIMRHVGETHDEKAWISKHVAEQGLVFDVFQSEEGAVQLVEVNPFGAMSGCGLVCSTRSETQES
jgi:hypothetical protein